MDTLLNKYRSRPPAVVFEWHDTETEAEGWVVINSLRGGAAGGGTRMRKGLNRNEVESLAKIMEIKFSVSGPAIGGAKSGINFDPADPRKHDVLKRWFAAVTPLLKHYYGTGGDLNIDEVHEVIPITEDLGLWHPQEGVVNGHFQPRDNEKIHLIGQLRYGVSKVLEDARFTPLDSGLKYRSADMITGYGVAESIRHYFDIYRQTSLVDKRIVIQGWGNVAGAAGYYLAQEGAKIVGIIDRDFGIIRPNGLSFDEVKQLFVKRDGNRIAANSHPDLIPFAEANKQIWELENDVFIPAAASKLVHKSQIESLLKNGLQCISCGANDPFQDTDLFFGETHQFADQICGVIPDFIANCGMARLFAYLMQSRNVEMSDEAMFNDISNTIRDAMFDAYKLNTSKVNLSKTALSLALKKLVK
jgi:glutamate dehydrogenase/leucine dehydrogenase